MRLTRQRTDEIRTFRETCEQGIKDCVPCIHAIVRMDPAVCPQPFPPSYVYRSAAVQVCRNEETGWTHPFDNRSH